MNLDNGLAAMFGVVIVAAGQSTRMGGRDKIFADLGGKPVLARSVQIFHDCPFVGQIVIVLNESNLEQGRQLVEEQTWNKVTSLRPGGLRRQDSVANGLKALDGCPWVAIHDGARPLVHRETIERGCLEVQRYGVAVAAVPAKDTVKVVDADGFVRDTPDRSMLWLAQTPQLFRFDIIDDACERVTADVTDDAALVERAGYRVKLFMGSYDNIKITTPEDLDLARAMLGLGARAV